MYFFNCVFTYLNLLYCCLIFTILELNCVMYISRDVYVVDIVVK